jgi:mono/diheme cytochrome c family protein
MERMPIRFSISLAIAAAAAASLAGCKFGTYAETRSTRIVEIEEQKPARMELAMSRFLFDDLGGLNTDTLQTNAMPWKVVTTAMLMESAARDGSPIDAKALPGLLQKYGWITTQGVDNWPSSGAQPAFDKPVGIVSGYIDKRVPRIRLEVANMGCAACHGGMSYDANGRPTGRVWLGAPNTSRYFDGYMRAILSSLNHVKDRPDELLRTIPKVFPQVDAAEIATIRKYVMPQIAKRLNDPGEILVAFDHGGAGLTNGIAALKMRLNAKPSLVAVNREHGYASIPDFSDRALRSSVLYDGLYALKANERFAPRSVASTDPQDAARLADITAFFVVPSMGIKPDASQRQVKPIREILDFVYAYRPQTFPGPIDATKAERGSRLYAGQCASCHGQYSAGTTQPRLQSFPNRLVAQADIGSDPARWQAITDDMVKVLNRTNVARKINADNARGYVAPILNGLWASAPYMHNGSVPTLWHFMRPEQRPATFQVGGHAVDFQRVGIAYPEGYTPWSTPVPFDTSGPGRGNRGHEKEFVGMPETDKDDLLEYLKLL